MADRDLEIPKPKPPEPTQPAPHPKEQRRTTVALWISCIAAFFALLAAIGSIWQAVEVRQARLDNQRALDAQARDVERSRRAAEKSADAAQQLVQGMLRSAAAVERGADLSRRQLDTSVTALIAQQRPLLELTLLDYDDDKDLAVLELKNSGHSTATKIDAEETVEIRTPTGGVGWPFRLKSAFSKASVRRSEPIPSGTSGRMTFSFPRAKELVRCCHFVDGDVLRIHEDFTYADADGRKFPLDVCYQLVDHELSLDYPFERKIQIDPQCYSRWEKP
jgi:hypothetical protein